jgi:hypothetical protein
MKEDLMLKMANKEGFSSTIKCRDKAHFDKLKLRFEKRGFKQVPYVKEEDKTSYPF